VSSEPYFLDTSYKMPASREITVIDQINKCLATELRSVIDKMNFPLRELSFAVDNDGKCHFKSEDGNDANPPKTWNAISDAKHFVLKTSKISN